MTIVTLIANRMYQKILSSHFIIFRSISWRTIAILSLILFLWSHPCIAEKINSSYPDLKWGPRPFVFEIGHSQRFIDFENGDDNNSGASKDSPWKHHPWDKNAKGNATDCRGIHTYCFKQGVIYRGSLTAKESGSPTDPIRLTVDPTWGIGKASICGSLPVKGGWQRCTNETCPDIPLKGRIQTWFIDTDNSFVPQILWEINDNTINRISIARNPNWKITDPDDPRSEWWELTGCILEVNLYIDNVDGFKIGDQIQVIANPTNTKTIPEEYQITQIGKNFVKIDAHNWQPGLFKAGVIISNGTAKAEVKKIPGRYGIVSRIIDNNHFNIGNSKDWEGATVWSERGGMPKPDAGKVLSFNSNEHSLRIKFRSGYSGPRKYSRYYLEDLPRFLDNEGEFYFQSGGNHRGRLFLRLPEDRNPNTMIIEAARHNVLIDINDKSHIAISGLNLSFSNGLAPGIKEAEHASMYASAVRILGSCSNIHILNMTISNASTGVVGHAEKKGDILDQIIISDSDFYNIDGPAIALTNGRFHYPLMHSGSRIIHADVSRNRVINTGYRVLDDWGMGPHSIEVTGGELVNIAGNIVDKCWGAGILSFNGSEYFRGQVERPLIRTLIHHNKVTNSLLGMQDYGGIASWMAGPIYVYSNISGNPVGYKHVDYRHSKRKDWYRTSCYGVGIYLDSQYKGYVFNNIIWGKNNNVNDRIYNSCGYNEAMGFMNSFFNNTIYRFGVGVHKGMTQHNRCFYLGNLMLDIGNQYFLQEPMHSIIEYDSLAYSQNIFNGFPMRFGRLGRNKFKTLTSFREKLFEENALASDAGILATTPQVVSAEAHNFNLRSDSVAIDKGVKVFVPWGLYDVVGEWNFFFHPKNPSLILGENTSWNKEWVRREMFQSIPRNNLEAHHVDSTDFKYGTLEDWTKGTLEFNGRNQYCDISDASLKEGYEWSTIKCNNLPCKGTIDAKDRKTLDMDANNFLIEIVCKTQTGFIDGGLVSKVADRGYCLRVDENGYLELSLKFGELKCFRTSTSKINDGKWHHIIAEVDRSSPEGINIYIDGKLSNGQWKGDMNKIESLSNTANFSVGKTLGSKEKFFKGLIDFLRISRGTLNDAETTIEELYTWELDGPFLKDFYGRPVASKLESPMSLRIE